MPTFCKSCKARLIFIRNGKTGVNMPCEEKKTTIVTPDGLVLTGHIPHWGNCDDPDRFRKRKGVK